MNKSNHVTAEEVTLARAHNILKEGTRLTRYGTKDPIVIGDATFEFDYRRDTFEFHLDPDKLKYIGIPRFDPDSHSKTFLTNSGQAAMTACYFYIDKVLNINEIESHNDYLYVGAYRLQDLYKIKHTKNPSRCLWICSTATEFEKTLELKGNWEVVVVDTTCWAVGSVELQKIYDHFKHCGLLIFFRSHSKLDMGGIEYGSLGNLTVFAKDSKKFQEASFHFRMSLGLNAGYAILDEIPPYLFSEDFFERSKKRCQHIVENSKLVQEFTNNESNNFIKMGKFIFPDHYKYFFFRFYKDIQKEEIDLIVKRLNIMLNLYLPAARSCASFGFNFPSVTFYQSDENIGYFVRFSPGVIGKEEIQKLCLCIREVLK